MENIELLGMYSRGLKEGLKNKPENLSKEEIMQIHKKVLMDVLMVLIDIDEFS
jgi:hypothetical protein